MTQNDKCPSLGCCEDLASSFLGLNRALDREMDFVPAPQGTPSGCGRLALNK